jgi:hypothetical protein
MSLIGPIEKEMSLLRERHRLNILGVSIYVGDMRKFDFNKDKYIRMAKTEGVHTALTRLHQDLNQWEFIAFEGDEGYSPDTWEALKEVRKFSTELWEIALENLDKKDAV